MKINHLSEATKILIMAATVIITCIIVWLGFQTTGMARDIGSNAMEQMQDFAVDIKDSGIMKFDAVTVEGSEVVNCIRKILGEYESADTAPIYITVTTSTSTNIYSNNTYISNIMSFADTRYIKPMSNFRGDVVKNENGVIEGIVFVQQ
ncbi:MAG: putative rane protein [Herbinix sp.]|jgi:hypothetical protein|nr:putative rane protein [Herbinix sp.]